MVPLSLQCVNVQDELSRRVQEVVWYELGIQPSVLSYVQEFKDPLGLSLRMMLRPCGSPLSPYTQGWWSRRC